MSRSPHGGLSWGDSRQVDRVAQFLLKRCQSRKKSPQLRGMLGLAGEVDGFPWIIGEVVEPDGLGLGVDNQFPAVVCNRPLPVEIAALDRFVGRWRSRVARGEPREQACVEDMLRPFSTGEFE